MEGGNSLQEEDPRRRNNFTLGLQEEISVRVVSKYRRFEKELKMAGDTGKKKCNLGTSVIFTSVNKNLSAELSQ